MDQTHIVRYYGEIVDEDFNSIRHYTFMVPASWHRESVEASFMAFFLGTEDFTNGLCLAFATQVEPNNLDCVQPISLEEQTIYFREFCG